MAHSPHDVPTGSEPGAASQPADTQGDGPVGLDDRTEPGGQGSPAANQARTEPVSPTPDHPEPLAVPDLSSMNVGAADPQAPRRGAEPSPSTVVGTATAQEAGGTAHRVRGLQGTVPAGESVDSDVEAGAARMATPGRAEGQGDAGPSPSSGDGAAPGTSEQQDVVRGSRSPR